MPDPRRVAVLISGRGTNMQALVEKANGYEIALVASNKPHAPGLDWARAHGIPTWTWDSNGIEKDRFDRVLSAALNDHRIGTIALAGFMRILSPWFIEEWRGRILNIHPSLLPKYRGLDTHARAIEAGETVGGCSVHVVTEELDAGEVLGQSEVPIEAGDTPNALAERVLVAEHDLYPRTLSEFVRR
jgi:phosphoribosylglycinamide formyltransferase 1